MGTHAERQFWSDVVIVSGPVVDAYSKWKPGDSCEEGYPHHIWERCGLDIVVRNGREVLMALRRCHVCRRFRHVKPD